MSHTRTTYNDLPKQLWLALCAAVFQPIILLGPPGVGKTWGFRFLLRSLYAKLLDVDVDRIGYVEENVAQRDAPEIAGVMLPAKDADGNVYTRFAKSPIIVEMERQIAEGKTHGILNLDEIAQAAQPEQKVCGPALDPSTRTLGGHPIPDGWIVVGTGNRAQDKSGATRLLAHLTDRVRVMELTFSLQAWLAWARENRINPVIIDFAEAHGDSSTGHSIFADAVPVEDVAYCTPRSLVNASRDLDALMADPEFDGHVPGWAESMFAANIGESAANLLCQWMAQRNEVPTAQEILSNPEAARVPTQTGFQMIAANVAMAAVDDRRTAEAAFAYLLRLRTDLRVSLATKLLGITARNGWTVTSPKAAEFIRDHAELLPLVDV